MTEAEKNIWKKVEEIYKKAMEKPLNPIQKIYKDHILPCHQCVCKKDGQEINMYLYCDLCNQCLYLDPIDMFDKSDFLNELPIEKSEL